MSKQPPPALTASAVGPCPTVIQIVEHPGTGSLPSTIAPPDHPRTFFFLGGGGGGGRGVGARVSDFFTLNPNLKNKKDFVLGGGGGGGEGG